MKYSHDGICIACYLLATASTCKDTSGSYKQHQPPPASISCCWTAAAVHSGAACVHVQMHQQYSHLHRVFCPLYPVRRCITGMPLSTQCPASLPTVYCQSWTWTYRQRGAGWGSSWRGQQEKPTAAAAWRKTSSSSSSSSKMASQPALPLQFVLCAVTRAICMSGQSCSRSYEEHLAW
jgi:hypothetical protein